MNTSQKIEQALATERDLEPAIHQGWFSANDRVRELGDEFFDCAKESLHDQRVFEQMIRKALRLYKHAYASDRLDIMLDYVSNISRANKNKLDHLVKELLL